MADYAPYQPGDICYVQEPYQILQRGLDDMERRVFGRYLADEAQFNVRLTIAEWERLCRRQQPFRGSPARFMYKSLARDRIKILNVGAQQIQQISEEDAEAEGIQLMVSQDGHPLVPISGKYTPGDYVPHRQDGETLDDYGKRVWTFRTHFACLWDSLHAHNGNGWAANRWVWAIGFERLGGE